MNVVCRDKDSPLTALDRGVGKGDAFIQFVAGTLKPQVDASFRTFPGREQTGLLGSSMNGLISMYGLLRRPETFGFAGAINPVVWFAGCALLGYLLQSSFKSGRIYLGVDMTEGADTIAYSRALRALLEAKGYQPGTNLLYCEEEDAAHCEAAGIGRIRHVLQFLLKPGPVVERRSHSISPASLWTFDDRPPRLPGESFGTSAAA
jgi:predicted alpha/beta superfamily hydrolase